MRLIPNTGSDRVIDALESALTKGAELDLATTGFSLFTFADLRAKLEALKAARVILPKDNGNGLELLGTEADRAERNKLHQRWLARECATWLKAKATIRQSNRPMGQSVLVARNNGNGTLSISGDCAFTTDGFGITPTSKTSLVQCTEGAAESDVLEKWFNDLWTGLGDGDKAKTEFLGHLQELVDHKAPSLIYYTILYNLFRELRDELDEERIVKSATGIHNTMVWKKLFKFQRDGAIGAIDKLERIGGCIIADSVGLGKTFEALAVIKYYELRNDRVLVLCPKRLRDNWTLYKGNDVRNILAADRFNYDVLNHTDLGREGGQSGDIDLAFVNWGNYDLVVIDESHNFRNKATHREHETRYDRLMRDIIRSGVKTKVLMLSATPVNNRLADLKNQIAFVTEGNDSALEGYQIPSVETTTRKAQTQFNRWSELAEADRTPSKLLDMLGFDYFKLLDLITIARSRRHIEKYYGTLETGRFPERLKPMNHYADVDISGEFPSIHEVNKEIRRLNLAAYAPLRNVLPKKQAAYDAKYSISIRGGASMFRQVDREESLIHLMRVNLLKRMESSVNSFALTLMRQLHDVEALLKKLDDHDESIEELDIEDLDVDDPTYESLLVGRKVKVLVQDVDRTKWRQELMEDRNRLDTLLSAATAVIPDRDHKLDQLKKIIVEKLNAPINKGNKKIIVFTAFADTAKYLYEQLATWAQSEHGIHAALVTGAGGNKTNLGTLRTDLSSILTAFSPRSKERPAQLADEGELDLLIATDCISEGQNLQDCDYLVNYDIHWNPVRIIQRFGRIDRIGSPNKQIQLVNFWPNMELDEYINLQQRVSGRMTLMDISATGEENIIHNQSGDPMNDLEYRRKQLTQLRDAVIDLENLNNGISITDLTLNDFRIDLGGYLRDHREQLDRMPLGSFAVTTTSEDAIPPGVIFCLRAVGEKAEEAFDPGYPLAPHYLVHVGDDGSMVLGYTQVKPLLDRLKRTTMGRDLPDAMAAKRMDKATKDGADMSHYQKLLAAGVESLVGKSTERAVASLFTPGGTHVLQGEFRGINDLEVVAYLVLLPEA
ncbi:MAG: helicase [Flavobacteriales bacterium]|nr:helicase [Flavobacteriales bacterium]